MTEDQLWKLLPVAVLIIQGLIGWGVWSLRAKFRTSKGCDAIRKEQAEKLDMKGLEAAKESRKQMKGIEDRLDAVEQRGLVLDTALANLPTVQNFHALAQSLEKLNGSLGREIEGLRGGQRAMEESVKSLGYSIDAVKHQVGLLMEHGLNGGNNGRS